MSKIGKLILILSGAISLWFSGKALHGAWFYSRLSMVVPAQIHRWEVRKEGRHRLWASYVYEVQGKLYTGETLFKDPAHLNALAAESDLKKWKEESWAAWVDPKVPSRSSLQRLFPWKSLIYALMSWGVSGYFLVLIVRQPRVESEKISDTPA